MVRNSHHDVPLFTNHPTSTMKNSDQYYKVPEPNQECMVEKLRQSFMKFGLAAKMSELYDPHPEIVAAKGKNQFVQRYHINRWIFEQLIFHPGDSLSVRLVLANDGPISAWFTLIDIHIVPFFLDNNLPKQVPQL